MHSPFTNPPRRLGSLRNVQYRRVYPGIAESVSAARRHLEEAARGSGLSADVIDTALVCLSELATNAVTHAIGDRPRPRFVVVVAVRGTRQRWLRVEVHDPDASVRPAFPSKEKAADLLLDIDPDNLSGRGMAMVATMADRTGVEALDHVWGKIVWLELKLHEHEYGGRRPGVQEEAAVVVRGVSAT
ncbi:ATP-binding protein [Streptomyces sp. A0642]|uniref:ATP-binding protein n=1 Tax=Streptomyces sp. A0642 TaxID=2563100 RepID=UPI0010A294B2|nr:ATP-binding protein [Streptomyces sp. A0642]THA72490.1 ATP-binding protein [Streptomyces sp. A0642]